MNLFNLSPEGNAFVLRATNNNYCRTLDSSISLAMAIVEFMTASTPGDSSAFNEEMLKKLDLVNRYIPVDINAVRDLAPRLQCWRNKISNAGPVNGIVTGECTLAALFGMDRFLTPAVIEAMSKCGEVIARDKMAYGDLINELCSKEN